METTDATNPALPGNILERAKAAADALNAALREAAREDVALTVAISTEPLEHGQPGPEVSVVEVIHHAHQEGTRPEDLSSANDD
ncbi:hypothetical protein [Jiella pelagia]|uniref:Uncharacterized protein n=1 Tax=Jiella pelagia TaxID=2986949 RepID=A0ABY7C4R1_9HYPH|nr:hypothetical protein [Jiella pelagia]WAP68810.1 hypothetical protein OH818_26850 [Jiella pelagia]